MEERENENLMYRPVMIEINQCVFKVSKSICKIILSNKMGTGFLIKLFRGNEPFYCLMTNQHIITKEMIESKETIEILYDIQYKRKEIILDKDERFIKDYLFLNIDAVIIEILDKEDINEDYFLLPDLGYINGYDNYRNKKIYIPQYPNGGEFSYSKGIIKEINKYEFSHLCSTHPGSSGSPIFVEGTISVIGIHKQAKKDHLEKYGNFIGPIIESLKKGKNESDGKKVYENGEYYIGPFLKGLRHGKGIEYYKNGTIKYDGDFVNDKYEGNGKFIYENGEYYIGHFLNGLKHGKGKEYYKNGTIKYDGDFVKDKYEGKGEFIYSNDETYKGQFLKGLRHGKGKEYYKNKSIKYDGDFFKNKYEGYGKYYLKNGEYYFGHFLNGLKHGKGIQYYKNKSIKYEGNFIKNKYQGNGKKVYENGEYYSGPFLNGLRHGKGKEYYKNDTIKYYGDFVNDKYEGNGEFKYSNGEYYIG